MIEQHHSIISESRNIEIKSNFLIMYYLSGSFIAMLVSAVSIGPLQLLTY